MEGNLIHTLNHAIVNVDRARVTRRDHVRFDAEVTVTVEQDELGTRHDGRGVSGVNDVDHAVLGAVQHEDRAPDSRDIEIDPAGPVGDRSSA